MNIKFTKNSEQVKPVQNLFESQQINIDSGNIEIKQEKQLETVFSIKSKQFNLDCGVMMASLSSGVNEIKFGLEYHDEHTLNLDEFLASVNNFLIVTGMSLTERDRMRLSAHYKKHSIHKNTV